MALRAGSQCLPIITRRKVVLGWGSALTVGLAAVGWRSCQSSHVSCGDIRTGCWSANTGRMASLRSFSTSLPRFFFPLSPSTTTNMSLTPPQPPPIWNHTAEDITKLTKESIETYRGVMNKVGGLDPKDCTYESVSIFSPRIHYKLSPSACRYL